MRKFNFDNGGGKYFVHICHIFLNFRSVKNWYTDDKLVRFLHRYEELVRNLHICEELVQFLNDEFGGMSHIYAEIVPIIYICLKHSYQISTSLKKT